ncbi:MAG TPA: prolipoprotein diacylglyceryl transferase family protein [Verrucomicrobiae bacterium]|jgi:phosphatidylglycerol:prolipoprotein diacylglycerol transferase|nr:prolipoprotein diacylglyceryl transferase family protein [Verrucomicrobiae bacterium]
MFASVQSNAYGWLMLAGILVSILFWSRIAHRDERLVLIYVAALAGAFLGAKLVYLGAEGWLHWHDENRWVVLATGKSITGALLGGYAAVEIAKHFLGYKRTTGDWFALVIPLSLILGRVGCIMHGCCLGRECEPSWFTMNDVAGIPRWPAALVELIFNALVFGVVLLLRWRKVLPGQHFHIYLMAYGVFRFLHEFLRATPEVLGPLSGYQIASLGIVALGIYGFVKRKKEQRQFAGSGVFIGETAAEFPG